MSFINMMANDIWSDADITNKTESMLRTKFSLTDEQVLNRKVSGASLGIYTLTDEDKAEIAAFSEASMYSQQQGVEARHDMTILRGVLQVEEAEYRLSKPELELEYDEFGNVLNQQEYDQDQLERSEAQSVIDSASKEVMFWVDKRRPIQEVVTETPIDE